MFYVNVYRVQQCYGGPEEGGWWYWEGEIVRSRQVSNEDVAWSVREKLEQQYDGDEAGYNVCVETKPGENYPRQTPHYC